MIARITATLVSLKGDDPAVYLDGAVYADSMGGSLTGLTPKG